MVWCCRARITLAGSAHVACVPRLRQRLSSCARCFPTAGCLSFHPMAQCVVHALKDLACCAPVLLAHADVTKKHHIFSMGPKLRRPPVAARNGCVPNPSYRTPPRLIRCLPWCDCLQLSDRSRYWGIGLWLAFVYLYIAVCLLVLMINIRAVIRIRRLNRGLNLVQQLEQLQVRGLDWSYVACTRCCSDCRARCMFSAVVAVACLFMWLHLAGYLSFNPLAQCVVHVLKGLACRARVTPAASDCLGLQAVLSAPRARLRQSFSRTLRSQQLN
jgi:hypothetical protein